MKEFKLKLAEHAKAVMDDFLKMEPGAAEVVSAVRKTECGNEVLTDKVSVVGFEFYSDYHCHDGDKGLTVFADPETYNKQLSSDPKKHRLVGAVEKKFGVAAELSNGARVRFGGTTQALPDGGFASEFFLVGVAPADGVEDDLLKSKFEKKILKTVNKDWAAIGSAALTAYAEWSRKQIEKLDMEHAVEASRADFERRQIVESCDEPAPTSRRRRGPL